MKPLPLLILFLLLTIFACRKSSGGSDELVIFPFSALGIPKGHLPPPGECKIWYPDSSPGRQGPSQSCVSAFSQAPLGTWIIAHREDYYEVSILSVTQPGRVDEVLYFALEE